MDLEFAAAKSEIEAFKKSYPLIDIETENMVCDYFMERHNQSDPEQMSSTWDAFEKLLSDARLRVPYLSGIKKNYFIRLCSALDSQPSELLFIGGTPAGALYIYADDLKTARQKLQKAAIKSPNSSELFGYLSYVHFLNKDIAASRICLREALEIDPLGVSLDLIADSEVLELIGDVRTNSRADEVQPLRWVVSYGCVRGVFPPKTIRLIEDLKVYVAGFAELEKLYLKNRDEETRAKLFYTCLVLSDNNKYLQHVSAVELTKIRKYMKEVNPALFKKYLAYVEKNR
ncbi:MAG: hypothetical protein HQL01_13570 [Nitrospirae bacterium]|nr:hypothetical protein [Nitrospirota bacterium]